MYVHVRRRFNHCTIPFSVIGKTVEVNTMCVCVSSRCGGVCMHTNTWMSYECNRWPFLCMALWQSYMYIYMLAECMYWCPFVFVGV